VKHQDEGPDTGKQDKGFWIPGPGKLETEAHNTSQLVGHVISTDTMEGKEGWDISQCSANKGKVEMEMSESQLDDMSSGETEMMGMKTQSRVAGVTKQRKKTKRKIQLQATRQSTRLKTNGCKTIEEIATIRKHV
jgi:hypothetical protein